MNERTALDEVLHSAQQMVNQQKFAYPPDWHKDATEIIYQGEMELKQLRADLAAAVEALRETNVLVQDFLDDVGNLDKRPYKAWEWFKSYGIYFGKLAAKLDTALARLEGDDK